MRLDELKEIHPFDTTTTGMQQYDQMMHDPKSAIELYGFNVELINMQPGEYISRCASGKGDSLDNTVKHRAESGKIDQYASDMKAGNKFPTPILVYGCDEFQQEGLHRALAAQKIGCKTMPVLVVQEQC